MFHKVEGSLNPKNSVNETCVLTPNTDPFFRLLEGAMSGPAAESFFPARHGRSSNPAPGGQGPHADSPQQLPGAPRRTTS